MNSVEDMPFKIPLGALGEVKEEVDMVTAPDITVPDYLKILQETEYVPSLENWVLTGLQGGYATQPQAAVPCSPSNALLPSCPPYWMMFSSPQESRLASRWSSDLWEPNPLRRCHSLNSSHLRVRFTISDSEDDDGNNSDSQSVTPGPREGDTDAGSPHCFLDPSGSQFIPAQPLPPKQQQKQQNQRRNIRQTSLSALTPPRAPPQRSLSLFGCRPSSSNQSSVKTSKKSQAQVPQVLSMPRNTKPSVPSQGLHPRPSPAGSEPRPLGSHMVLDSSVELLSALSEEEKKLVEAIMEHGYTLRTAIISLQKTREHSSEQILNYLVTFDRLCRLGYDEAKVEEALEMFQNSETKAAEFLHLQSRFNEMGFQENAIKEVLLMHENHCERALEELMTRVA